MKVTRHGEKRLREKRVEKRFHAKETNEVNEGMEKRKRKNEGNERIERGREKETWKEWR